MALQPGDALFNGHYRIIRQLGRGGFGFVYLAQDTLLAEEVAIKELIPALVGDETSLKRFLAEAKATMRLTHRRIVRTHNVFSEGGNYYIVMEYMPGGSLEDRLSRQAPLPVEESVRIAAEVCEGLACAHEAGVVHCDLKPHNILFDSGNSAKVADFGIAHVSGETLTRSWMTPAGFVAGTLPYMSPEQADGVRDDPRIDIYAAGAMLYRMLTGRTYLEFDSRETPGATADNVNRIRNQAAKAPSTGNRSVPAWLDAVVLKALAKDPAARYQSAASLQLALTANAEAEASPAGPETVLIAPRRPKSRSRLWIGIGAVLGLVVAVVIGGPLLYGGSEDEVPTPQLGATSLSVVAAADTATPESTRTTIPAATPTSESFPTSTPVSTVMPDSTSTTTTETSTPTATSTLELAPTPQSVSPSASPTSIPSPSSTPSSQPTARAKPTNPSPTAASPGSNYPPPFITGPENWAEFQGKDAEILLTWDGQADIGLGERYLLTIYWAGCHSAGKPCDDYPKELVAEEFYGVGPIGPGGRELWQPYTNYHEWKVAIVQPGSDGYAFLSPYSSPSSFVWQP